MESHGFQRGWRGDLSVLTAGRERDQALFIARQPNSFSLPPSFSPLQKSIRLHETSKGSTYIITGITISIRPQSFGSGIILETLRALHFFHVVLRKFRVAIRGAAAMIQNKSCNATFPQDTPGYNELENSWHAPLLSRFFPKPLFPSPSLPFQCYLELTKWSLVSGNIVEGGKGGTASNLLEIFPLSFSILLFRTIV